MSLTKCWACRRYGEETCSKNAHRRHADRLPESLNCAEFALDNSSNCKDCAHSDPSRMGGPGSSRMREWWCDKHRTWVDWSTPCRDIVCRTGNNDGHSGSATQGQDGGGAIGAVILVVGAIWLLSTCSH